MENLAYDPPLWLTRATGACNMFANSMPSYLQNLLKLVFPLLRKIEGELNPVPDSTKEVLDKIPRICDDICLNLKNGIFHEHVISLVDIIGTICPLRHRQECYLPLLEILANNQPQCMEEDVTNSKRKRAASGSSSPTPPISNETAAATYASIAASTPLPATRPTTPAPADAVNASSRTFHPTPFFVKVDKNWTQNISVLNTRLATRITARIAGDTMKLIPCSQKDSDVILNFLNERKLEFSSSTPKTELPRKIAIRGIPAETDITDISQALTELGFKVQNVRNIQDRRTKRFFNLYMAEIFPTQNWDRIYKVSELLNIKVNFKPFKSRGNKQPQCHRCQRYGHSSRTCNFSTRCVKCAGDHASSACTNPRTAPPVCCLCSGSHTANFSGCPAAQLRTSTAKAKAGPPVERQTANQTSPAPATEAATSSVKYVTPEAKTSPSAPLVSQQPPDTGAAKKKRKHRKKRPALSAEAAADNHSVAQVDETEICAPASDRGQGQYDLPSETKELMREFCSCVSEVRAWFNECSISEVAKSVKEIKTDMGAINFPKLASLWRELETSYCLPAEPAVQLSNLLAVLSKHLTPVPET